MSVKEGCGETTEWGESPKAPLEPHTCSETHRGTGTTPPQPTSCSGSLKPLISQLCPSKLSWLSAQFISSHSLGAKYLSYYCNYFPIRIVQG